MQPIEKGSPVRQSIYASKVQALKGGNPLWWKEVRKLSGSMKKEHCDLLNNLTVPDFEATYWNQI